MQPIAQSINSIYKVLSLKYKLFIILLVVSIIPISLVSYSSQYFMFKSSTEYTASVSSQYVKFVSRDIVNYLDDLNRSLDPLVVNWDFQTFIDVPKDDILSQADHELKFRNFIQSVLQIHKELLGILYLDESGKAYYESYQKQLNFNFSFQTDLFYKNIYHMKNKELTTPHSLVYNLSPPVSAFSFIKPVINLKTGKVTSWLVIEIKDETIKNMLSGSLQEQDSNLLLYHPSSGTVVGNSNIDSIVLQDLRKSLETKQSPGDIIIFESEHVKYQTTFENVPYGEWKLVWLAPLSSISKGVHQSFGLTLLIAVISLAISLFFAFPVMNTVLRPLYKLKAGLQSLGRGTYVPIPLLNYSDEIGFLIRSYNQMLQELQRMEQEVYLSKLKEKERELLQLQAQINPHFLFNTLETIESYATTNDGEAVGDMVQSVSTMMRYNVRSDGGWAPLREEIEYIRHFLNIHYYRHNIYVTTDFIIEPSSLDIPVMKLSIQPFVENSIKYGWSPNMNANDFSLTIKIEMEEHVIHILIRDTGSGMPQDVLGKIKDLIACKGEHPDPFFRQHTGIANVYRRFLLAYGDQTSIEIASIPYKGTEVSIRIPFRE